MPSTVDKLTVNVPLNLKVREVFEVFTRGQKGTLKKTKKFVLPAYKKITSQTCRISGTSIVSCPPEIKF
jgi:hypothetical protein